MTLRTAATQLRDGPRIVRDVPEFGALETRRLTVVLTASNGLKTPRDLDFNPMVANELWVANRDNEGVVIVQDAGRAAQRIEPRHDAYAYHFMSKVSSIAFGSRENFASCHESLNEAAGQINFMGPTLWSSDLAIFAKVNQQFVAGKTCRPESEKNASYEEDYLGSHIDMLHQSPLCMGIGYESENAFWAFDGKAGNLVRYDFVRDHGPGRTDHSDGRLRRFVDVRLTRVTGVPSHIVVNPANGHVLIADTGTGRVLDVDTSTGRSAGRLSPFAEPLAEYTKYTGGTVTVLAEGMRQPSGLALVGDRLFVSDHATGEIVAISLETRTVLDRISTGAQKIMGLAISPDGKLWFTDGGKNQVVRVDPE